VTPVCPSVAEPFATIVDGLCRAVAARAVEDRAFAPVALLLWGWLRRVARRFAALAGRAAAGTLRPPAANRRCPDWAAAKPRLNLLRLNLPRGFGWLGQAVPYARPFGGQLTAFLATPEAAALLAAAPQAARLLRPLCRMLGARPIPALPPPRHSTPRADAPTAFAPTASAPTPFVAPPPPAPRADASPDPRGRLPALQPARSFKHT
jgi:hypothetical protein